METIEDDWLARSINFIETCHTARVTRILDGSETFLPTVVPKSPVWGHVFGAGEQAAGGNPAQTIARQRIKLILRYLETIQEK